METEHKIITRKEQELNKKTRTGITGDSEYKMPKTSLEPDYFIQRETSPDILVPMLYMVTTW